MIKIDYETLHACMLHTNGRITIYQWDCNIGFGQIVVNTRDGAIIDDENMGVEFAKKVIEKAKENEE